MPGWEIDPNIDAAEIIAYGYNLMGDFEMTFGQFPVDASSEKVQNFFDYNTNSNISVRIDPNFFPE